MRKFEKISREQWIKDTGIETRMTPKEDISSDGAQILVHSVVDVYDNDIQFPQRSTTRSAGYDLISPVDVQIPPHSQVMIPSGLKVNMEADDVMFIIIRSSLGIKKGLSIPNQVGVIDSDYYNNPDNEGHFWICLRNNNDVSYDVHVGDRISQAIFVKYSTTADDQPLSDSRNGGFGSTGI